MRQFLEFVLDSQFLALDIAKNCGIGHWPAGFFLQDPFQVRMFVLKRLHVIIKRHTQQLPSSDKDTPQTRQAPAPFGKAFGALAAVSNANHRLPATREPAYGRPRGYPAM
jgi:hypothetical protein